MKFTESMLREFVMTPLSATEIGDLLTMSGFELEEITEVKGEKVFNVNIMANRGDGASVLGIAREILAKDPDAKKTELSERAEVRFHAADQFDEACSHKAKVTIESPNCNRFAFRVFEGVQNGPSPDWLKDRLEKVGQRSISLLVDLTNYVMFELGQPLHAFDLDKLEGGEIIVRQAQVNEKSFTTLDGEERKITPDDLMVCDATKPRGIAGIMGGLDSEVSDSTKRMLLESASFNHIAIRNTRTRLGLQTEASYRFERHVDPNQVDAALNRFAELYEKATGDWPVRGIVDLYPRPPQPGPIALRMSRVERILGLRVEQSAAVQYLTKLGVKVQEGRGELDCIPPTWRIDIVREDDLVEEIGRIHGYDKIPERLPRGETTRGGVFGEDAAIDEARNTALRCGLTQIISHSLRDVHPLDAEGVRVRVRNPHSPEIAFFRNSNLPCLADAANRNGNENLHLFEIGKVIASKREFFELAILSTGGDQHESWQKKPSPTVDFYAMKGIVEALVRGAGAEIVPHDTPDRRMHPARQAALKHKGKTIGTFGQINPVVSEQCGLPSETCIAQIDLSALAAIERHDVRLKEISKNPATRRDIAIAIAKDVPFDKVQETVQDACGDVLEKLWLFDVYEGKGIPKGQHSLAIALQLRKVGANFTDEEANQVRDKAVKALEALGAKLR